MVAIIVMSQLSQKSFILDIEIEKKICAIGLGYTCTITKFVSSSTST